MYKSTRDNFKLVPSYEAIRLGMVPTGGLFVPKNIPTVDYQKLLDKNYQEIAIEVIKLYLPEFEEKEIAQMVNAAYKTFTTPEIVSYHDINEKLTVLELFNGPTGAFKDIALQLLPHFIVKSNQKCGYLDNTAILVATSGDTGPAALAGFKNIEKTKIACLYPKNGVSYIQKKQMVTIDGNNTFSLGVDGNFDDCQTLVKNMFGNPDINEQFKALGYQLSSANSINWGRLLPQIIYYISTYIKLINSGKIKEGEMVNFVVPTGNFGNILSGWYAKQMGIPINKLISASNKNDVLVEFFNTGKYSKNREFHKTNSPSMDIVISSNLERFIYEAYGRDGQKISELFKQFDQTGQFTIKEDVLAKMGEVIYSNTANELEVLETINNIYKKHQYLIDPHTAVAFKVQEKYRAQSQDDCYTVIVSTATPFKFSETVTEAIEEKSFGIEALTKVEKISKKENIYIKNILTKKDSNLETTDIDKVVSYLLNFIKR